MTVIPYEVSKKAQFEQEFRNVIETKSLLADVVTKLISKAKNIKSPYTSVTAAKAHTAAGRTPVGTATLSVDELVLDRKIGNAILDVEEELSYANFDIIGGFRRDLYASVLSKMNIDAVTDFVADATVVAGTVDLSTAAKVTEWLMGIDADVESGSVGLRSKVDGATVKRGKFHGKPVVLAGRTAYVQIISSVATIAGQSSLTAINKKMTMTPYGVLVVNLGSAADNVKRLIYGTGGAMTMAFREDTINTDMGTMTNVVTATANDLDVLIGDDLIEKKWYILAETKGKNGIYADVQSLVSTQLML